MVLAPSLSVWVFAWLDNVCHLTERALIVKERLFELLTALVR